MAEFAPWQRLFGSESEVAVDSRRTVVDEQVDDDDNYIIVDKKGESDPVNGFDPIPARNENDKEVYWQHVTRGKTAPADGRR